MSLCLKLELTLYREREEGDVEQSYVRIVKGKKKNYCDSYVGRRLYDELPGDQEIVLGANCMSPRSIVHEFMHSLGFVHEHQRIDRNSYVIGKW